MIRFASLGSGSKGNGLVVQCRSTVVLVDCGFGPRECERRLHRLGVAPNSVSAVLVTHEHSDHLGGVVRFATRHGCNVFATHGTLAAGRVCEDGLVVERISGEQAFVLGDLEVLPFSVPHDAREPVQYRFSDGVSMLGVLTDAGGLTPHIQETLAGCSALVIECNHDQDMLARGKYPPMLKRRIGGSHGHLSNDAAAELLQRLPGLRLQHVVAAHLSQENNTPALARAALAGALSCSEEWIGVADQGEGFDWREVR